MWQISVMIHNIEVFKHVMLLSNSYLEIKLKSFSYYCTTAV